MPLGAFRLNSLARFTLTAEVTVIRRKVGVTAVGNAQVDTAQSKFGGSSLTLNAFTLKYLTTQSDRYSVGTGDFTIEGWVYQTASQGAYASWMTSNNVLSGGTGYGIYLDPNDNLYAPNFDSSQPNTTSLTLNTWQHIALCRAGGFQKLFLDGVIIQEGSANFNAVNPNFWIGTYTNQSSASPPGYMDEVRVSNVARYTANFTPHTAPHVNDDNTLLLIHANGTDGSTVFEDDNGVRQQVGVQALGNAQVSTAQSKFSGASALFDGTGDLLRLPNLTNLGTGDFTIETWVYPNVVNSIYDGIFTLRSNNEWLYGGPGLVLSTGSLHANDVGNVYSSSITAGSWQHIAVVRSGTEINVYINGSSVLAITSSDNYTTEEVPAIGVFDRYVSRGGRLYFDGWMDCYRISNTARYTANFTPPTEPFVNDDNTLLLLHMDGTNGSTYFDDDNGVRQQVGVSAIGNTQVNTAQSKFGGASALFDGTGDYLEIPTDPSYSDLNGKDFTFEAWVYPTNLANAKLVWDTRPFNGSAGVSFGFNNSAIFINIVGSPTGYQSAGSFSTNTWYHVGFSKQGDDYKVFVDGAILISFTESFYTATTSKPYIGRDHSNNSRDWTGNIDEVRISNTSRYTANFTPPTEPFVNDDNTLLLLHMDGTDGSTVFVDDNGVEPKTIQG